MAHMKGNMTLMKGNMALMKGNIALTKGNMALRHVRKSYIEHCLSTSFKYLKKKKKKKNWIPMSLRP